jgi:hypothetical protein
MPLSWAEALKNKTFILHLVGWLIGLAVFIIILPYYFNNVLLHKPGIRLNDLAFTLLTPRDWSNEIFFLIFGAPTLFFIFNFRNPEKVLTSIQCYVVVNFLRITSLYIFTLETPEGIIPLVDPFLERVAYGGNAVFTKDLFFSGHTSTLFIIFLLEDKRNLKIVILISTILIGLLLIWQRVHYTIDVLGAVIVTSLVVEGIRWLNKRTFGSSI